MEDLKAVRHEPGQLCIDYGVASRAMEGQSVSGDLYHVECFEGGVLMAVVDGLGHGIEAARAAAACVDTLRGSGGRPLPEIVEQCHEAVRDTRGVVLSLASFDDASGLMTWLGVGNVEGILIRRRADARPSCGSLPLRGGVVGVRLPRLLPTSLPVERGDILILATDGIAPRFVDRPVVTGPVQCVADRILQEHGRRYDDALVVVARYRGPGT